MAQRGRKPTPTTIKELEGNPGIRPLIDAEPKPERKAPPCPKWLEPEAKKEWRRHATQMAAIGIQKDELEMAGELDTLLSGEKTNVVSLSLVLLGVDVVMDATLQLVRKDGDPLLEILGIKPVEQ